MMTNDDARPNVIPFPVGNFTCLSAGSGGWFILYTDASGPREVVGPFANVLDARAWAAETGERERVRVDWATFPSGDAP
jgi:hypothetical protein